MTLALAMPFYVLAVYRTPAALAALFWASCSSPRCGRSSSPSRAAPGSGRRSAVALTVAGIASPSAVDWTMETARREHRPAARRPSLAGGAAAACVLLVVAWRLRYSRCAGTCDRSGCSASRSRRGRTSSMPASACSATTCSSAAAPARSPCSTPSTAASSRSTPSTRTTASSSSPTIRASSGWRRWRRCWRRLGWMLWQSYRRGSVEQRLLAVTCAGALTGFAVHNLADAANIWKAALVGAWRP